jgi:hypothetical protein
VAKYRGCAQLSICSGNHKRGITSLLPLVLYLKDANIFELLGSAGSRSILNGYAPFHISRLHVQGNVHTKGHYSGT